MGVRRRAGRAGTGRGLAVFCLRRDRAAALSDADAADLDCPALSDDFAAAVSETRALSALTAAASALA